MPATPFTPAARLRGPDALPTPETGATLPGARAAADLLALSPGQVQEAMQRGGNSIAEVYTWYTEMVGAHGGDGGDGGVQRTRYGVLVLACSGVCSGVFWGM
jgi:hypothetical protein